MADDYNQKYVEFAAHIQFYEFLQEEFKEPHFKVDNYSDEITRLKNETSWDVNSLSDFLRKHPKSFEIFQEIFQLSRFTNTQLTHFLFDVKSLNSLDKVTLKRCLIKNLEKDGYFFKIYINELKKNRIEVESNTLIETIKENEVLFDSFVWILKSAVFKYVSDCIKKSELLHQRLSSEEFKEVSERTAKYLIENLKVNNVLKGLNVKEFLSNKRIGIDTKSIHGKFGNIKIKQILEKHNIINADNIFNKLEITELRSKLSHAQLEQYSNKVIYVTEKYIEGIKKKNDNKPKKFDFIILYDLKPKILIETNYYTTSGTKIKINEDEYTSLNDDIKKEHPEYVFIWITDGNFWLTKGGRSKLLNLYPNFGDNLLNYHLFDKSLEK